MEDDALFAALGEFSGLPILAVVGDAGRGVVLEIGTWRKRARRVRGPELTAQLREYEGSLSLYFTCPWEWTAPDAPIRGPVQSFLDGLPGRTIDSIALVEDFSVVQIQISDGSSLRLIPADATPGPERQSITLDVGGFFWIFFSSGRIIRAIPRRHAETGISEHRTSPEPRAAS